MTDLSDAILECSVPITVVRQDATQVEKGRVVETTDRNFEIMASVQPMNQKELRSLPEGQRNEGRVKLYTRCELRTVTTSECKRPDRFSYRGVSYEIAKVDDWFDLGGYYRCEAARLDR